MPARLLCLCALGAVLMGGCRGDSSLVAKKGCARCRTLRVLMLALRARTRCGRHGLSLTPTRAPCIVVRSHVGDDPITIDVRQRVAVANYLAGESYGAPPAAAHRRLRQCRAMHDSEPPGARRPAEAHRRCQGHVRSL